jgi:hypothetical protein
LRQVRPDDAPALARAYARLGEQSRYRRLVTVMPELPEATLKGATEVDHENHEALVALPLLSPEIVGECRFVRLSDRPDTADLAVTVVVTPGQDPSHAAPWSLPASRSPSHPSKPSRNSWTC